MLHNPNNCCVISWWQGAFTEQPTCSQMHEEGHT